MATIYILHLQEVGTSYYCSSYSIGFQRFDIIFDPRYEGIGHISLKVVDGIGYCFPFIFFGKIITENLDECLPLYLILYSLHSVFILIIKLSILPILLIMG